MLNFQIQATKTIAETAPLNNSYYQFAPLKARYQNEQFTSKTLIKQTSGTVLIRFKATL